MIILCILLPFILDELSDMVRGCQMVSVLEREGLIQLPNFLSLLGNSWKTYTYCEDVNGQSGTCVYIEQSVNNNYSKTTVILTSPKRLKNLFVALFFCVMYQRGRCQLPTTRCVIVIWTFVWGVIWQFLLIQKRSIWVFAYLSVFRTNSTQIGMCGWEGFGRLAGLAFIYSG